MCCSRMTIGQLLPNTKAIMLVTSVSSSEVDKSKSIWSTWLLCLWHHTDYSFKNTGTEITRPLLTKLTVIPNSWWLVCGGKWHKHGPRLVGITSRIYIIKIEQHQQIQFPIDRVNPYMTSAHVRLSYTGNQWSVCFK